MHSFFSFVNFSLFSLNLQLLDRPDLIVTHIVKTIDKNTMKGTDYILVVDMSWVTISVEFQRRLIPNIPTLLSFPKEYVL
jgi:hypothetical protein